MGTQRDAGARSEGWSLKQIIDICPLRKLWVVSLLNAEEMPSAL